MKKPILQADARRAVPAPRGASTKKIEDFHSRGSEPLLQIENLHVQVDGKEIIKGISFDLFPGKVYALMGPNGSGKSTLASTIIGHPKYHITEGRIFFQGKDIAALTADERARLGIFLSFQYPKSIPGVTISHFLRMAYQAVKKQEIRVFPFQKKLKEQMDQLHIPHGFLQRSVNEGFSGGEKKKGEILQAMVLEPSLVMMDETDSGLDVDALKVVSEGVQKLLNPERVILLITHYSRIFRYLLPDEVLVVKEGRLVAKGDAQLAEKIEEEGFEGILRQSPPDQYSLEEELQKKTPVSESSPFVVLD